MAALFVKCFARDVGCADAHVAGREFGFSRELFELVDDRSAARQPKRKSGADIFVDDINLELASELAMIAFFCFIEHCEILVELRLVLERRSIKALKLW